MCVVCRCSIVCYVEILARNGISLYVICQSKGLSKNCMLGRFNSRHAVLIFYFSLLYFISV